MKETILLKQITPMWHFEPDINGCCLRATEVKPKLDRFLLSKEKEELGKYKIGDTEALDYKLSFDVGKNINVNLVSDNFRLFFGNIGEGPIKNLIYYTKEIEMKIFSLNSGLIPIIKENLREFFATHSFGTRQDKGFGYFFPCEMIIKKSGKKEQKVVDTKKINDECSIPYGAEYKLTFDIDSKLKLKRDEAFESVFKHIEYFHKLIRSGINIPGRDEYNQYTKKHEESRNKVYYKSLMYYYAKEKNLEWDKPSIRHHFQCYNNVYKSIYGIGEYKGKPFEKNNKVFFNREDISKENNVEGVESFLFREALGLASRQEWMAYDDIIKITAEEKDYKGIKDFVLTRFKSPINYRPYVNWKEHTCTVYIYFDENSLEEFKNFRFSISSKNASRTDISPMTSMQVYPDFSLSEYFNMIESKYGELVLGKYHGPSNSEVVKYLNDIKINKII